MGLSSYTLSLTDTANKCLQRMFAIESTHENRDGHAYMYVYTYIYLCVCVYVTLYSEDGESNVDTSCGKFNIAINSALASFPLMRDVSARVN